MLVHAARYTYTDDTQTRDRVRPAHRAWLADLAQQGVLLGSGPADEGTAALLVFATPDRETTAAVLADDPFAREGGVIARCEVLAWDVILGPWAG